jgi:peptidoglycan hydrolase-like protein with peptidoglycan-binding domain
MSLRGSVGLGGRNWQPDVVVVQRLLERAHVSPGPVDGRCGRKTMQAIERFQQTFLRTPDGRIDVNGPTLQRLQKNATAPAGANAGTPAAAAMGSAGRPRAAARPSSGSAGRPVSAAPSARRPTAPVSAAPAAPQSGSDAKGYWRTRTPLPPAGTVNVGLTCPSSRQMEEILGDPHNARTTSRLKRGHFGSEPITALEPALASIDSVLARVKSDVPDLYAVLGTAGMYALRNIRGRNCYSNHSWGTAIDVKVDGLLVALGASYSCKGLDVLCRYFNDAGWYWGGGYHSRKDAMHFECGLALVRTFK